jgi:hypothetical protein
MENAVGEIWVNGEEMKVIGDDHKGRREDFRLEDL